MGWQETHLAQCFEHPGIVKGEEAKYCFLGFWVNHEVTSEKKPPWSQAGLAIPSPFWVKPLQGFRSPAREGVWLTFQDDK